MKAIIIFQLGLALSLAIADKSPNLPDHSNRFGLSINDVPGIVATSATLRNSDLITGATGVFCLEGCNASVVQEGGAPCTAQTDSLQLQNFGGKKVAGVILTGGSMHGLYGASSGAFRCLSELPSNLYKYLELDGFRLPHVSTAALLDLPQQDRATNGSTQRLPAKSILRAYEALAEETCRKAYSNGKIEPLESGAVGAGTSAAIWNDQLDPTKGSRGGLGTASLKLREGIVVGAVLALNVFGQVTLGSQDWAIRILNDTLPSYPQGAQGVGLSTAIGVVATNLNLSPKELRKVTSMAYQGLSDAVFPVATPFDGDTFFGLSTSQVDPTAPGNDHTQYVPLVGAALRMVVKEAVTRAVCCGRDRDSRLPRALSLKQCADILGHIFLRDCRKDIS